MVGEARLILHGMESVGLGSVSSVGLSNGVVCSSRFVSSNACSSAKF